VKEIVAWGVLDGVMMNLSLVVKEGKDFKEKIHDNFLPKDMV
jgi:hypothetical protein